MPTTFVRLLVLLSSLLLTAAAPTPSEVTASRPDPVPVTEVPLPAGGWLAGALAGGPPGPVAHAPGDQVVAPGGYEALATIGNGFYDECDDSGPFDLKKLVVLDDQAAAVGFAWGTCSGKPTTYTDGEYVAFGIYDGTYDSAPTYVAFQWTSDAWYELYDTLGSNDPDQWWLVDSGYGSVEEARNGHRRTIGSFAIDAVESGFPYAYALTAQTFANGDLADRVPNPNMPAIVFPWSCEYYLFRTATVTANDGAFDTAVDAVEALGLSTGATSPTGGTLLAWPVDNGLLDVLGQLPSVAAAVRPTVYRPSAVNDPEPTQWALDQTHLEQGWSYVPHNTDVQIAVLDSGVDGSRPDLSGRVLVGHGAYSSQRFPDGHNGSLGPHGTAVSGIAAATRNNNLEVVGVNPGARIRPVRVFDHANCATDASLAAGLDWVRGQSDIDVVNMSLGGTDRSDVLRTAVRRVYESGKILIGATGNNQQSDPNRPTYPASYPEVIGVGATEPGPRVAGYSQTANAEFVAPGGSGSGERGSDYAVLSEWDSVEYGAGTSFASPFVAGAVSLWLADHPTASVERVREALIATAVDLPGTEDGHGLVDVERLLAPPPIGAAPGIDGDPATTHRLDTDDPVVASVAVSKRRFRQDGVAPIAVVSRSDRFPDALSASPLTADGPLLFTPTDRLDPRVRDELVRTVADDGTVYVLGGPGAVSDGVVAEIRSAGPSWEVRRLAGPTRYATSRAIVDEVVARSGVGPHVLLARAYGPASDPDGTAAWADAIAAGGFAASRGAPLLVVPSDRLTRDDLVTIGEATDEGTLVTLLGGTAALSDGIRGQLDDWGIANRRVSGSGRAETAAAIARTLWGATPDGNRTFAFLNPWHDQGWVLGLASAGFAADVGAPTLALHADHVPTATGALAAACNTPQVEAWVAASRGAVPGAVTDALDRMDGQPC